MTCICLILRTIWNRQQFKHFKTRYSIKKSRLTYYDLNLGRTSKLLHILSVLLSWPLIRVETIYDLLLFLRNIFSVLLTICLIHMLNYFGSLYLKCITYANCNSLVILFVTLCISTMYIKTIGKPSPVQWLTRRMYFGRDKRTTSRVFVQYI